MHPHIFITAKKFEGLRSVEEVRQGIQTGHLKILWEQLLSLADTSATDDPYNPTSILPDRSPLDISHANREWTLVNAVSQRIQRAGLAYLISENPKYRDDALRQLESLFDTTLWPDWRDKAHHSTEVDLRGGMLSSAITLAYDWMHPLLTETERKSILNGFDKRGLQPYFRDIEANAYWADVRTNWLTTIVGGYGIAGMALAEDHPRSQELVDFALPGMIDYLDRYGPEGEFNESVGYSSSTSQPVAFFTAHRYATQGGQNRIAEHPFPQTCHWTMYFTLPPGRYAAFGDGQVNAPPALTFIPAVADATQNSVLQKFYLDYANLGDARRSLAWELLWYNPDLKPTSLNTVPTGRAYHAHGANFSSRTDWNPTSTPSLVYGKGGSGAIVHGHHDVGQICIDGYGERLIVDLGSPPGYPGDYGSHKYEYYNASAHGHNILTFGGKEMKHSAKERAEILNASFENEKGGIWQVDLTPKYDGVKSVRRTVAHLHPEIIAVLDEAELETEENISLRWHTISPSKPDTRGNFVVQGKEAFLSARIVELNGQNLSFASKQHEYRPPYNRHRLGDEFGQLHEPYIETELRAQTCRILSLFSICPPGNEPSHWLDTETGWQIKTIEGDITAIPTESALELHTPRTDLKLDLFKRSVE
jgi:hypothetical protein